MEAIRQFIDVKDNAITISLSESFNGKRVEVIVIPDDESQDYEIPKWQRDMVSERISNTAGQMDAFDMLDEIENNEEI